MHSPPPPPHKASSNPLIFSVLTLALPCILHAQSLQATDARASDAAVMLEEITVTAPLNPAFEVNVGAFGARDTMEVPLSIQSYDASTIRDTAARTAMDVLLKRLTREPFVSLTTEGSSLNGRYLALDTSDAVFGGKLGWRLNAAYEKVGNFNHAGDLERKFVSLATDLRLSERALLQVNADWYRKSVVADPLLRADQSGRADPLDPSSYVLPPRIDRRDLLAPSWWRYNTEVANLDAKLEYRLDPNWVSVTQLAYSQLDGGEIFTDYFDIQPNGDIGARGVLSLPFPSPLGRGCPRRGGRGGRNAIPARPLR